MQFRILLPRYIMNKQLNILKGIFAIHFDMVLGITIKLSFTEKHFCSDNFVVLGMLAILASQSMATEYCEICSNHIGCRNNGVCIYLYAKFDMQLLEKWTIIGLNALRFLVHHFIMLYFICSHIFFARPSSKGPRNSMPNRCERNCSHTRNTKNNLGFA